MSQNTNGDEPKASRTAAPTVGRATNGNGNGSGTELAAATTSEGPLEVAAYLARSENRFAILRAVDRGPRDRRELEAETGASRSTLSRVIRELDERGWIHRTDGGYATTAAGSLVVGRFVGLLETVGGVETLGEGLAHLPVEEMSVDVRHFHDASLVTPTEFEPTAAVEYGLERLRESGSVDGVARAVAPSYVRAIHERATGGDLDATVVLDAEYLDAVAPDLVGRWREVAACGEVRRYDGRVPYHLFVLDDAVHLWLRSDDGDRVGLLESENPTVREWATSAVADYRAEARPIEPRRA